MLQVSIFFRSGVPKVYIFLVPDDGLVSSRFPKSRDYVNLSSLRTKLVHIIVLHNCGESSISVGMSDRQNSINSIRDNRNAQLAWLLLLLLLLLLLCGITFIQST